MFAGLEVLATARQKHLQCILVLLEWTHFLEFTQPAPDKS